MYPILLQWGPIVLPAWHTFYVLGAVAAYWLLARLARRHAPDVPDAEIARVFIVCYVAGYFCARLLSIVIEETEVQGIGETLAALARFGPMTFYGGAIGSFVAGVAYTRWRKLPLATLLDAGLPAGLLALAIGRVGCFLNGDDYGLPVPLRADGSTPFWAVTFPNLRDGIPRYPVQLLEAFTVAVVVAVLVLSFKKLRQAFRPGAVALFAIVAYANLRFALELLRGDFRGSVLGTWLSTSQFISLLALLGCALTLPYWLRKPVT